MMCNQMLLPDHKWCPVGLWQPLGCLDAANEDIQRPILHGACFIVSVLQLHIWLPFDWLEPDK